MTGGVGALDVVVFVGELVLLAGVAVAGSELVPGVGGVGLAVALVVVVAFTWGRWLAPRAAHRLRPRGRLAAKTVLALAAGALLAAVGRPGWAVALCLVAVVFAVGELRSGESHGALS